MQDNNSIRQIKIQEAKSIKIDLGKNVKISIQGAKYIDVMMSERPLKATTRKLSKDEYVVVSTGEIKKYRENIGGCKSKDNLKKTFNRLRQLIRTNFAENSENQLFITLTYGENMTDEKRLMKDFEKFYKRLKYRLKGHKLDYIVVAEPQERGAWHLHLMLKSDKPVLFIDEVELTKIWGFGRTTTERLKSDDVGSYYVAYFVNLCQNEEEIIKGSKESKKIVKGRRLYMYPKSFKFYRCSRGIKKPEEKYVEYGDVSKNGFKKTYERAFYVVDEERGENLNFIQKEVWKK